MKDDRILSTLKEIYQINQSWLHYAETKNTSLIAFNAAISGGLVAILFQDELQKYLTLYIWIVLALLTMAAIISMLSMVPELKLLSPWIPNDHFKSLIYFNSISLNIKSSQDFLTELSKAIQVDRTDFSEYEQDLANQIIQVAKISSRKYEKFKISIWITILAIGTPILAIPALLFHLNSKRNF